MLKLVISGGGDYTDSKKIDDIYKEMLNGKRILYIPRAMHPNTYESCHTWIQNVFPVSEGYSVYSLFDKEFVETSQDYLNLYDGIYIGGGNSFRLLKLIRETGFSKIIEKFLSHNKPIYGGSAGAIIMGKEIHTAEDRNIVKLSFEDSLGFNLCNGYSLACHYSGSKGFDNEIVDYIKCFQIPVLCLPEGTGIVYNKNINSIQGNNPAYVFDLSGKKTELKLGDIL